jgi:hypothetical protein
MRSVLLAIAALLALAPSAGAAWTAPFAVSPPGGGPTVPRVALDGRGDGVAVWNQTEGGNIRARFARLSLGGSVGAPLTLSAPGANGEDPDVAVDSDGDALAVWERSNGSNLVVQAAWLPRAGAPGAVMNLSADGRDAAEPRVAIDPDGDATAVWTRSDGAVNRVQAVNIPALGAPGPVRDVSPAGEQTAGPRVEVERDGDAVVAWIGAGAANKLARVARLPFGGTPTAPRDLSAAGGDAEGVELAVDDDGDAVAVWQRSSGAAVTVQAAALRAGSVVPEPAVDLAPDAFGADVGVDPSGDATAVWSRSNGANSIVQAARIPLGGAPLPLGDLSAPGQDAIGARVAVDRSGGATALWQRFDGANRIVQAARAPAGGRFGAAVSLSRAGADAFVPALAVDPNGEALVVWERGLIEGARFELPRPPAPPAGGAPAAPALPVTDTKRPALRGLAARRRGQRLVLRFSLSEAATARVRIVRCKRGRCRRVAVLSRRGKPGANRIQPRLAPGRYAVTITAIDAAGNQSRPRRLRFRMT